MWLSLRSRRRGRVRRPARRPDGARRGPLPDREPNAGTGFAERARRDERGAARAGPTAAPASQRADSRGAAAHGRRMAQSGQFGHADAEGSASERIRRYYKGSAVGEAIAWRESELSPAADRRGLAREPGPSRDPPAPELPPCRHRRLPRSQRSRGLRRPRRDDRRRRLRRAIDLPLTRSGDRSNPRLGVVSGPLAGKSATRGRTDAPAVERLETGDRLACIAHHVSRSSRLQQLSLRSRSLPSPPPARSRPLPVFAMRTRSSRRCSRSSTRPGARRAWPALRRSPALARAAADHARAMGQRGFFSHSSADGTSPGARIRRYYRGSAVGETILWRSPDVSAAEAISMWLKSPPHRVILLQPRLPGRRLRRGARRERRRRVRESVGHDRRGRFRRPVAVQASREAPGFHRGSSRPSARFAARARMKSRSESLFR